jgi:hypothetical protein
MDRIPGGPSQPSPIHPIVWLEMPEVCFYRISPLEPSTLVLCQ